MRQPAGSSSITRTSGENDFVDPAMKFIPFARIVSFRQLLLTGGDLMRLVALFLPQDPLGDERFDHFL